MLIDIEIDQSVCDFNSGRDAYLYLRLQGVVSVVLCSP